MGYNKSVVEEDDRTSMLYFKLKRKMLMMIFFLRMFMIGVEYSVIIPTALLYVKSMKGSSFSMGLVVAAYPFAALLAVPLFGYFYDKTLRVRELFFLLNLFELAGNILYSLNFSIWLPIIGRLVAGVGDGFAPLVMGEIAHLYSPQARIGILSLLELGRVFGLILGPTLNFLIEEKHFIIQSWILDNKTLPGVIMAVAWFLLEIFTALGVYNLALEVTQKNKADGKMSEEELLIPREKVVTSYNKLLQHEAEYDKNEDERSLLEDLDTFGEETNNKENLVELLVEKDKLQNTAFTPKGFKSYFSTIGELLTFEFFTLFYIEVTLSLIQTSFEIFLPYITEFEYHWAPQKTGLVYVVGGIELVLIFLILYTYGQKYTINDSYLLILSIILTQFALGLLIYEVVPLNLNYRLIVFSIMAVFVLATIPFNLVCMRTLITKIYRPEVQGLMQGYFAAFGKLALILGPLIGSASFKHRQIFGAVLSVANFIGLILMFSILNRIKKREKELAPTMMQG